MHNTFAQLIGLLQGFWICNGVFYAIGGYTTYLKAADSFGITNGDLFENFLHKTYGVNTLICYTENFTLRYEWLDDVDRFMYTQNTPG